MDQLLLHNMHIFDGWSEDLIEGQALLIEDGVIRDMGDMASMPRDADRIDLQGQTLLPGLIDAHFHAYGFELDLGALTRLDIRRQRNDEQTGKRQCRENLEPGTFHVASVAWDRIRAETIIVTTPSC